MFHIHVLQLLLTFHFFVSHKAVVFTLVIYQEVLNDLFNAFGEYTCCSSFFLLAHFVNSATNHNFVFSSQQTLSAVIGDRFSLALFSLSLRATLKVAGNQILLAHAHTVLLVATALANAGPADSSKSLSSSWSQTLWRLRVQE